MTADRDSSMETTAVYKDSNHERMTVDMTMSGDGESGIDGDEDVHGDDGSKWRQR